MFLFITLAFTALAVWAPIAMKGWRSLGALASVGALLFAAAWRNEAEFIHTWGRDPDNQILWQATEWIAAAFAAGVLLKTALLASSRRGRRPIETSDPSPP